MVFQRQNGLLTVGWTKESWSKTAFSRCRIGRMRWNGIWKTCIFESIPNKEGINGKCSLPMRFAHLHFCVGDRESQARYPKFLMKRSAEACFQFRKNQESNEIFLWGDQILFRNRFLALLILHMFVFYEGKINWTANETVMLLFGWLLQFGTMLGSAAFLIYHCSLEISLEE